MAGDTEEEGGGGGFRGGEGGMGWEKKGGMSRESEEREGSVWGFREVRLES